MSPWSLIPLMPLIILAAGTVAIILMLAFVRRHVAVLVTTLATLGAALLYTILVSPGTFGEPQGIWPQVTSLLAVDSYARFFTGLLLGEAMIVTLLSYSYLRRRGGMSEEFYVLLLLATLGGVVLVASTHFASLFLGLETLTVSLYVLIAYHRRMNLAIEAGFKYLVLAAVASAFLLMGMAFVYAELGTMQFSAIAAAAAKLSAGPGLILLAGLSMISVGVAFKLALVPFHLWTADVYQGAPAPVTLFIATVSKGAIFALLLRYFRQMDIHAYWPTYVSFFAIAATSMVVGNLLALLQRNLKRILAYSSIAHMGYLLVALLAAGELANTAVAFYLLAYFVTISGALAVVTVLSPGDADADDLEQYRALAWRRPVLAGVLAGTMLSLAGIPLTAGFIGKIYLLASLVQGDLWILVATLVVGSIIGLFFYLRVIAIMYMHEAEPAPAELPTGQGAMTAPAKLQGGEVATTAWFCLAVVTVLLVGLGVYPDPVIRLIRGLVHLF